MNKKKRTILYNIWLFLFIVGLIALFFGMRYYKEDKQNNKEISKPSATSNVIYIPKSSGIDPGASATLEDYSRIEKVMSQNEIIQKLPDKARILISFYNFNTGSQTWERGYLITKGSLTLVDSIPSDLDMKMAMHSRWLSELNNNNLCLIIDEAKAVGNFGVELVKGKTSLLWKYKSLFSYRDCLGF